MIKFWKFTTHLSSLICQIWKEKLKDLIKKRRNNSTSILKMCFEWWRTKCDTLKYSVLTFFLFHFWNKNSGEWRWKKKSFKSSPIWPQRSLFHVCRRHRNSSEEKSWHFIGQDRKMRWNAFAKNKRKKKKNNCSKIDVTQMISC